VNPHRLDQVLSREQAEIMIYVLKKIPEELRRLAVIGIVAGIVATAVIYSGGQHVVALEDAWQAFQQPMERQQAQGWFTPTPRLDIAKTPRIDIAKTPRIDIANVKAAEFANTITLPRSRTSTPGFYYELVRAQGDGEGDYVLIERKCIPKVDMPEPCYLPERGRQNFPLRRE
jgi:hypothetical protein